MLGEGSDLGPCRLRRTKLKAGRKLTASFDVTVLPARTARAVAVAWRPDSPEPADGDGDSGAEAEAEAAQRGLAAPFRRLSLATTDGMRVDVAPLDAAFPHLVRLTDPAHVAAVAGYDRPPVVATVRYRPGQRHVLRYEAAEGGGKTLFAKLYRDESGAERAAMAETVAAMVDEAGAGCRAVRPAASLADDQAVLFPMATGVALAGLLRRGDRRAGRFVELAGSTLRSLHDAPPPGGLCTRLVDDEVAAVGRAAETICALLPGSRSAVAHVLSCTPELLDRLANEAPTFVHGDYKCDHLLVGRTATLIDLDRCGCGDPALDLAKFLADLRWWLGGAGADGLAQAEERFLAGYRCESGRLARARALEPLFSLKVAARRVHVHETEWDRRTADLVEAAARRLRLLAG